MDPPKQTMERIESCIISNESNNNGVKRKRDIDDDEEQQRKKRKLNENAVKSIEHRVRELFAKNISLMKESYRYKRERDRFEKERTYYKKQMEEYKHYKYKYSHLKKQIISLNADQSTMQSNNHHIINSTNKYNEKQTQNIAIDDVAISPSSPLLREHRCFINKPNTKNNKDINTLNQSSSKQVQLNDMDNLLKIQRKSLMESKKSNVNDEKSVIMMNRKRKKSLFSTISNRRNIDETSKKRKNKKRDLERKCILSSINNKYKTYHEWETDESNDDDESVYVPSDNDDNLENGNNYIWEDCHFVSVDCKICGKHFNDFNQYIDDLQYHFDSDPSKTWLKCNESGCNGSKVFSKQTFVSHLHRHQYGNPFHCKMLSLDGNKCNFSTSLKGNLVTHLAAKKHNIKLTKRSKKYKYKRKFDTKRKKK